MTQKTERTKLKEGAEKAEQRIAEIYAQFNKDKSNDR